jgi:pSer/pThr/pTyr-binding forkhead associated (FHA) protein
VPDGKKEEKRQKEEADNDLSLPDQKASRQHAILRRQGTAYQITDLNSSYGTYVNGQRLHLTR